MANGTPDGAPTSLGVENLISNRGIKLSWSDRNITKETGYRIEARKFLSGTTERPITDNLVEISSVMDDSGRKFVEVTRMKHDSRYEFKIIPTNPHGDGPAATRQVDTPDPSYYLGHQADHTVLYKHGTFVDDDRALLQGAIGDGADAWDGIIPGVSACKESSSCKAKNGDGGIITVTSVATTRDDWTGGCETSFACVRDGTTRGTATGI